MKVAMDPSYISGRWPNMRRGSVWGARKISTQMGEQRPIEQISDYRTPIQAFYQVGVSMHPADAVIAGFGIQLLEGDERRFEPLMKFGLNGWNGLNYWNHAVVKLVQAVLNLF